MQYKTEQFKDGQWAASLIGRSAKSQEIYDLVVDSRCNSYDELFRIASIKEAWDYHTRTIGYKSILNIYCLIGQRSDRRFFDNGSFDLKVVCNFINSMNFDEVNILDPHSDVAPALLNNCKVKGPAQDIATAFALCKPDVIVSPDAGAYKKIYKYAESINRPMVACNKVRSLSGDPKVEVNGIKSVAAEHCLIIDDIADGGRTFIEIAKELKEMGASKVFLYVTHGMFHYGFDELKEYIDHIYCTNSYRDIEDEFVTQFKVI